MSKTAAENDISVRSLNDVSVESKSELDSNGKVSRQKREENLVKIVKTERKSGAKVFINIIIYYPRSRVSRAKIEQISALLLHLQICLVFLERHATDFLEKHFLLVFCAKNYQTASNEEEKKESERIFSEIV